MPDDATATDASDAATLSERLTADLATLDAELGEIDLLISQAQAEATRHVGRRTAAETKLAGMSEADPKDRLDLATNLVTLTKRAALMEAQVDVLEGKRRALTRYRDALAAYVESAAEADASRDAASASAADSDAPMPAEVSRLLLTAQEDLRREIARAMHDGPAQSLTNIVLQAQIVERLVEKDPAMAAGEVRLLIAMVQQTLDATKSFIFDVRPMVLDDLGLVPTLRRATRDRGHRAAIPVDFDSMGQDRRLPMDLESGLFRMLDEALAAYLAASPERVTLRLDWSDTLEATVAATRSVAEVQREPSAVVPVVAPDTKDLPPALAAMMEDRIADERELRESAEREAIVALPDAAWREIQSRASSIGVRAELLGGGGELRLVAELPAAEAVAGATP